MVLATGGEHLWVATLYYSLDDKLNFYFLSDPATIHCQQIATNPKVALSISDSPQNPTSLKRGIQISGTATQIEDKHKVIHALNLWKKTLGVTSNLYSYEGMLNKAIKGRMYKVVPSRIKFFNEELWEEGAEPVITL